MAVHSPLESVHVLGGGMLCREHRGGKTVPKIDWAIRKRAFQVVWAISGQWIGQLDGYVTAVSECVKCGESGGHAAFVGH